MQEKLSSIWKTNNRQNTECLQLILLSLGSPKDNCLEDSNPTEDLHRIGKPKAKLKYEIVGEELLNLRQKQVDQISKIEKEQAEIEQFDKGILISKSLASSI